MLLRQVRPKNTLMIPCSGMLDLVRLLLRRSEFFKILLDRCGASKS